jgi:hypothetical protein
MTPLEARVQAVRGGAGEKSPTIRVLASASANHDCPTAMLALATRTDLDSVLNGTYFEAPFGQDPQAFLRGQMFEANVKGERYGRLIQLLREHGVFPPGRPVAIHDLKTRFPANKSSLAPRAEETRRLLREMVRRRHGAPIIIDGAVLTCRIANQIAYFEADGLAASSDGGIHVAEIKSFDITDGRCDEEKFGSACDQAAWYALLARMTLSDAGLDPSFISDTGFIILPQNTGLTPVLVPKVLTNRIERARQVFAAMPDVANILAHAGNVTFPAKDAAPDERLIGVEQLLDAVGTRYRPECLKSCALSRLCRARAHQAGLTAMCGSNVVRQLPNVPTLQRAAELTAGAPPGSNEAHVADSLMRADAMYTRAMNGGPL